MSQPCAPFVQRSSTAPCAARCSDLRYDPAKSYGVADGDGDASGEGEAEVEELELELFLVADFSWVPAFFMAAGEGEAMELFFAVAEELDVVVVEVSPLLFWQQTKNAAPRTQTMVVRTDFFIGLG